MINRIGFHFDIVDNQPVTTNFCRCYSNIAKKCSGQTFDFPTISKIWNDFVSQLVYRANFLSCFKFLYNIIDTIEASELSDKDKALYMERTQALLNQDELLCYYINLIVSSGGYEQRHLATLRKYNFFKDLVNSDLYKDILHSSIASFLKQMMSGDS
ncbi:putative phage abortive infection protein [Segatella sp.]|uniref:putative phage abortive infection protein n=1 Tax=Segatella sp. TaxID=2974253 RepID=UPI00308083B3